MRMRISCVRVSLPRIAQAAFLKLHLDKGKGAEGSALAKKSKKAPRLGRVAQRSIVLKAQVSTRILGRRTAHVPTFPFS